MMKRVMRFGGKYSADNDTITSLMIDRLGRDVFVRIRERIGGLEIDVPRSFSNMPDHWIVRAVGTEDALALAEAVGGLRIYMPMKVDPIAEKDSAKGNFIREAILEGSSLRDIAIAMGVSQRWVRTLIGNHGLNNLVAERYNARKSERDSALTEQICQLRAENKTPDEMANALGMSKNSLYHFVRRKNIDGIFLRKPRAANSNQKDMVPANSNRMSRKKPSIRSAEAMFASLGSSQK